MISLIKKGHKAVCANYKEKPYVVGFSNTTLARHVQYNLLHDPEPIIYLDNSIEKNTIKIQYTEHEIPLHLECLLYVQKAIIDTEIINSPYHLDMMSRDDFLCLPIDKMLGIVLVENVIDECDSLIIMNSNAISASFIPSYFRHTLKKDFNL
jgi:hypothetical protein